jgi:hypothetical protein
MAYGLKHYIDFPDTVGINYRVCLLFRDFVGDPTPQRAAPRPFIQDVQVDDIYKPIWGTIFEINAMSQLQPALGLSGFKLEDLFLEDEKECLIEFRKNPDTDNTLLFKGWMSGHRSSSPLNGGDWPLAINAGCGLGQLKNEEFKPSTGLTKYYRGRMSYLEVLTICLQKTGLELPFSISSSWQSRANDGYFWAFDNEVDVAAYHDESGDPYDCAKVLSDVLEKFNCVVFQEDARYYILNVEERARTTMALKNYTTLGAYVNTTSYSPRKTITYDGAINFSAASYGALPPKKQFEASVTIRNTGRNLIKNGDFVDRYTANVLGINVVVLRDWYYTANWNLLTLKPTGIELGPAIALPGTDAQKEFWIADNEIKTMVAAVIPVSIASDGFAKLKSTVKYVPYTENSYYPICVYSVSMKNSAGDFCYLKQDGTWTIERTYETYIQTADIPTESQFDGQQIVSFSTDIEMRSGYELIGDPLGGILPTEMYFTLYRPSVSTVGSGGQKVLILELKLEVSENTGVTKFLPKVVNPDVASSYEKESFTLITGTQNAPWSLTQVYLPNSNESPIYWDTDPEQEAVLTSVFDLMLKKRANSNSRNRMQFEGDIFDANAEVKLRDVLLIDYFAGPTRLYLQTRRRYDFRMRKIEAVTLEELIY